MRAVRLSSADAATVDTPTAVAPDNFPRWFLWFAGGLIAFSLVAVGLVRITGNGPDQRAARGVLERHLYFHDRSDGGIDITDAHSGDRVAVVHGEQGFLRGTLRALVRERKQRGIGPERPFELIARHDGGLTLYDPSTRQRVDLESFGPSNAANFARLLPGVPPADALAPAPADRGPR
ncbi:MAG: photosynthetic complex assembly protein PuhC [Rubrivivax sp.]|jgi:putative photosynthetic complex assembly protein|nr:photosynthetic complex assembly protein PuhC [Rubrivivax sp.]